MPSDLPPVSDRDHVLGAASPEVTLVEYGDFGCSHCFAAKLPVASLLRRFPTMRLVWRHFPKPDIHPGADLAAELSEFAAAQGLFWEAHSLLLAGRPQFAREDLEEVAGKLELDWAEFDAAHDDHSLRGRVEEDVAGGRAAGVSATPTFFLNGDRLRGHWRDLARLVPAAAGANEAAD